MYIAQEHKDRLDKMLDSEGRITFDGRMELLQLFDQIAMLERSQMSFYDMVNDLRREVLSR